MCSKLDKWITKNIAWVLISAVAFINCIAVFSGWYNKEIALLSTINASAIGAVLAYIAHQQWQINITKVNLDLYDKRYKSYESMQKFISKVVSEGKCDIADLQPLLIGTRDIEFLFKKDIFDFRKYIMDLGSKLHIVEIEIKKCEQTLSFASGHRETETEEDWRQKLSSLEQQRFALIDKQCVIFNEFVEAMELCKNKFNPYLNFSNI